MKELKKLSKESMISDLNYKSCFNKTFKKHCVQIDFTFELISDEDIKILEIFYKELSIIQLKNNK
tara:strand:+ start:1531 stop:1725 length:195 start_codon:yes stop_codon:yes gene_type:complete